MTGRMKFYLILCFIMLLVSILIMPNPFDGKTNGAFYYKIDFAWCLTPYACVHEAGHMIDAQKGWVSESAEYQIAISNLRDTNEGWRAWLLNVPNKNTYQEIYAEMYYLRLTSPNAIPQEFEKFYQ